MIAFPLRDWQKDIIKGPFAKPHNMHKDYTMESSKDNFIFIIISWHNINAVKSINDMQLS